MLINYYTRGTKMLIAKIRKTDTEGKEIKNTWEKKYTLELPDNVTDIQIITRVKKVLNWVGLSCRKVDNFTMIELKPYAMNEIAYIEFSTKEDNDVKK